MGILELAERVQLSPGSVHRLLATLVGSGWVEQNSRTAKYRLGTRMLGIGATGLLTNPALREGMPFLARVVEATGHDAVLATLVGLRTVALARVAGNKSNRPELKFEPGLAFPAHASAEGKLLLSYLSKEERLQLYAVESLPAYTASTLTTVAELEREIKKIQTAGYAVDNGERYEDTRGLAVPVLGPDQRPILALLCIGALDGRQDRERTLARFLSSLASELSERLVAIGDLPLPEVPVTSARTRRRAPAIRAT